MIAELAFWRGTTETCVAEVLNQMVWQYCVWSCSNNPVTKCCPSHIPNTNLETSWCI